MTEEKALLTELAAYCCSVWVDLNLSHEMMKLMNRTDCKLVMCVGSIDWEQQKDGFG